VAALPPAAARLPLPVAARGLLWQSSRRSYARRESSLLNVSNACKTSSHNTKDQNMPKTITLTGMLLIVLNACKHEQRTVLNMAANNTKCCTVTAALQDLCLLLHRGPAALPC
jgi:hypothetical protein